MKEITPRGDVWPSFGSFSAWEGLARQELAGEFRRELIDGNGFADIVKVVFDDREQLRKLRSSYISLQLLRNQKERGVSRTLQKHGRRRKQNSHKKTIETREVGRWVWLGIEGSPVFSD
jgi:hypothetical protein